MNRTARGIRNVVVLLLVLAAVAAALVRVGQIVQHRRQAAVAKAAGDAPLQVAVVPLGRATLERRIPITGEIKALQVVDVVSKVTGQLERLRLPDGQPIDEGTIIRRDPATGNLPVIAVIEHKALEATLRQAQAALQVARASQGRSQVLEADALREKKRIDRLYEQKHASDTERDRARTAYERCLAELAMAKAQVAQAQAAAQQAEVNLQEAVIASPVPGVVITKYVDEGNMVGPSTPLLRIVQIDAVKVIARVSERHLAALAPGKTMAVVRVDAFEDEQFTGCLCRVADSVDPTTRTVDVEVRLPNPGLKLKPGMFARVSLVLRRRQDVSVVPDAALLRDKEGAYVYVVNGSKAHRRRVTLGLSEGVLHEVVSGLEPGDRVVVRGQRQLTNGQPVSAVQEDHP